MWPGVGNRHRGAGQRRGDVLGQRLGGRDAVARQGALAGDLHRPLQPPRLPGVQRDVERRGLLEVLAFGVADLVGVAVHRGAMLSANQIAEPEVVDVGVGQQDCAHVVGAEAELAQRGEHVVAVAGKAGVDQHDAVVVGDQRPVHQVGLREVDGVGDGCSRARCHARESRREE